MIQNAKTNDFSSQNRKWLIKYNGEKICWDIIENREDGSHRTLDIQGLFPLVGQIPNTTFIKIDGVLNEWNTIPVERNMMSSCTGLFAGGDVLPREIRQIYLAEHDGMVAAKSMIEYLKWCFEHQIIQFREKRAIKT